MTVTVQSTAWPDSQLRCLRSCSFVQLFLVLLLPTQLNAILGEAGTSLADGILERTLNGCVTSTLRNCR